MKLEQLLEKSESPSTWEDKARTYRGFLRLLRAELSLTLEANETVDATALKASIDEVLGMYA
jgi:hypothetical protein